MTSVTVRFETAHLDDGIDIFYTDSGAPPGSTDYTTVIVLHGTAFTGRKKLPPFVQLIIHEVVHTLIDNLRKLHDYAHNLNLRTVIWNRRDYAGSTKYTEDELDDLKHGRAAFLDRLGTQLAQFLLVFIERHNIPEINNERTKGGFAIMGWSLGNTTAISLFSRRDLFSTESYSLLETYVKDLIIYDATLYAFGWKLPPDADHSVIYEPMSKLGDVDSDASDMRNFHAWVSSYYDHPENPKSINDLHFAERTEHASSDNWSTDELESFHEYDTFVRSELPMQVYLVSKWTL
ncbi:hypothetical protein H0H87_003415 [Tephrocybe sp. NHM501043]|nr:hypothetical protein H0H87_003415 [Tephrocybe sp. NHM501043]